MYFTDFARRPADFKSRAIPGFDVIKMKREIQAKIYEEIKDMTTAEHLAYIRAGAERFDQEQAMRRAELALANNG